MDIKRTIKLNPKKSAAAAAGILLTVYVVSQYPTRVVVVNPATQPASAPALPVVANELRAHCNLDAQLVGIADRWAHVSLCTDLAAPITKPELLQQTIDAYRQRNPKAIIGTYLSGCDVAPSNELRFYPREMLPIDGYDPAALMPTSYGGQRRTVDIRNAAAAKLFASEFAAEIKARPWAQCVMIDNLVAHPSMWSAGPTWDVTLGQLCKLRDACHANGKLCYANSAFAADLISAADTAALASSCDGVLMEMSWMYKRTRTVAGTLATIATYRALPRVLLMPLIDESGLERGEPTYQAREREATLLAALAYMAGPHVSVSTAAFRPPQPWEQWPAQLGKTLGEPQVVGGALVQRCERGILTLDVAGQAATVATK